MHIRFFIIVAWFCFFSIGCQSQTATVSADFGALQQAFHAGYSSLNLPGYTLSYVNNLKAIPEQQQINRQAAFFKDMELRLKEVKPKKLSAEQYRDYRVMVYETAMNQHRIRLATQWNQERPTAVSAAGISGVPNGKAWYRYYLKRWVDLSVEPDELYAFGLQEVEQVKAEMLALAQKEGKDLTTIQPQLTAPERYYNSPAAVKAACEKLHRQLLLNLPNFFPKIKDIPPLKIAKNPDKGLEEVPGFYRNQTFFYTYFDRPFEKRQVGWLYTHEGLPGHHYERNYTEQFADRSAITELFRYSCYTEGWAAYIEEIGKEFGAYPTLFDEYGKWEWDLIRSLRVPMDIGLNYYGWTDEKALAFWQEHSTGLDHIARREIARVRRWPAQVITYKHGAETILRWQQVAAKKSDFSWVAFHAKVLQYGPLPLSLLEELMSNNKS